MSMWRNVRVIARPLATPVTFQAVKDQLRVISNVDDQIINDYLHAAVGRIDGPNGIGFAMMAQTWELTLDAFPEEIILPGAPVTGVASIAYDDADQVEQVLDPAAYRVVLSGDVARVRPVTGAYWPNTIDAIGAVRVAYTLGAEKGEDVPEPLRQAVRWLAAHYFVFREPATPTAMIDLPMSVEENLNAFRRGAAG